ncbi:histidyl-tRNA synthetase [Brevibacillus borstelensis AK1]|uniref:Histidine--tRNA ligase n=1 Tax=Brevibacillus borstelensis AK1 TaxID=1300222 RepID=M8E0C6_9BACL|nr:histidine--tRNA ligase [Brevibacillus borstelensis]EMT52746.1 histidyl-tRNA synthetase [Brevibacillus borstelensis AK1]MED2007400.1 histidine--tRNA ligase [Brevibacillus borstelensis]
MAKIQIPRGTQDIMPGTVELWHYIEAKARDLCRRFNYHEIRTPLFESTELFQRGVGETTDIVEKEMYNVSNPRSEDALTLRPEGTAGVVRSYVENKLYGSPNQPVKMYYLGPMFRHERPQAGRYRQFVQFGAEAIGSSDPAIDAEVIALAMRLYQELGLTGLSVELNSVGTLEDRANHRKHLLEHLNGVRDQLCPDCQSRIDRNPLRVLDCKNETCKTLTKDAPSILEYLSDESAAHFEAVKAYLTELGIAYTVNPRMVRGLDYYTQTAFEIKMAEIGAVETLCGGGRYNGLVAELGGDDMPGIGFALSIERLLLALEKQGVQLPVSVGIDCFVAIQTPDAKSAAFRLVDRLRSAGVAAELDYLDRKMKAQLKQADRLAARFTVIIGESELASGTAVLKEMATGEQQEIKLDELPAVIASRLG